MQREKAEMGEENAALRREVQNPKPLHPAPETPHPKP